MRKGNCSRDSVLYHHLSMPQPELIGKPTPSFCLSCYFLGSNDPEVGPKQPQLYISQVRFSSRELPPVFTSDDSYTFSQTSNIQINFKKTNIYSMKYLKKHNEVFGIFKKFQKNDSKPDTKKPVDNLDKNSMWVINPKIKFVESSGHKYHVNIIDDVGRSQLDGKFNIESLSNLRFNKWYNNDTALWLKDRPYNRQGKMVRISNDLKYFNEGGKLYDFKKYFDSLQTKSKELGYTIGTSVYVKEFDKVGKIESLRESCICTTGPLRISDAPENLALTIYYRVNVPGESHPYGFYYNIFEIEKIEKQEKLKIDPEYVSDFFIDLIDNESIKLDIEVLQNQEGEYLLCRISYIERIQPIFNELMENYLRLSSVMNMENDFITEITDISLSKISFKIKQTK